MGSDEIYKKYCKTNLKRILNILILKNMCLDYNRKIVGEYCSRTSNIRILSGVHRYCTFFSNMNDTVDNLLFFLINEEVSNSIQRKPLGDMLELLPTIHEDFDEKEYFNAIKDVLRKGKYGINEITQSCFLDFTVSTYSCFELWVSKIYEVLKQRIGSKNKKKKRLKKIIEKFHEYDDEEKDKALDKIMKEFSSYVSGKERIDFVLGKARRKYSRDYNEDVKMIKMYSIERNTIHNMGVYTGNESYENTVEGSKVLIAPNKPAYYEDLNASIAQCKELVHIYFELITCLDLGDLECCIESPDQDAFYETLYEMTKDPSEEGEC